MLIESIEIEKLSLFWLPFDQDRYLLLLRHFFHKLNFFFYSFHDLLFTLMIIRLWFDSTFSKLEHFLPIEIQVMFVRNKTFIRHQTWSLHCWHTFFKRYCLKFLIRSWLFHIYLILLTVVSRFVLAATLTAHNIALERICFFSCMFVGCRVITETS